jgi:hypothetical protein
VSKPISATGSGDEPDPAHIAQDELFGERLGVNAQVVAVAAAHERADLGPPGGQAPAIQIAQRAVQGDVLRQAGLDVDQPQVAGQRRVELGRARTWTTASS